MSKKIKEIISKPNLLTFSKKWTNRILWFSVIWVSMSYILAFLGKGEIAQSLSNNIVKVIIGVFISYSLKAFAETYCEKKNELKRKELDSNEVSENEMN
jgi:hypothetical protein